MKYGKEITHQIAELLAGGMGRVDSCDFAGISYETFTVWMGDKKKPEFSEAIKKAEMACKQRNIARIQNASKKSWQAAAWWLERKHPEEFALRYKVEATGKNGGPLVVTPMIDLSKWKKDELVHALDILERQTPT